MGHDIFENLINILKLAVIMVAAISTVPMLVWAERRGSAFIQNRLGPNRVGPLGLTQLLADALKFLSKEEFSPSHAVRAMFYAAPIMALIPGLMALAAIPLSVPVEISSFEMFGRTFGPYNFLPQGYDIGIGIVFVLGISSLGAYSLLMAGWGSNNKYSLLGGLRASAQLISYELALGLSLVGILMIFGSFHFRDMVTAQTGPLSFMFMGETRTISWLPNWGVFYQPLGALIFYASAFAESNRLPFDLPEADAELVAGFHTEYGGIKFNMFFMGEYVHMIVACALLVTFYFGGYSIPGLSPEEASAFWTSTVASPNWAAILTAVTFLLSFMVKVGFFLWVFIWVRWTLPRFRYDQLMNLGWKTMLPWALANVVITAIWLVLSHMQR